MSLLGKVALMLGFTTGKTKAKADYIGPDLSKALQRNEMAGAAARAALQDHLKQGSMAITVRDIAGKM